MRTAKELAELLRSWQSRERGKDFEEIAQVLERQEKEIERLKNLVWCLKGDAYQYE